MKRQRKGTYLVLDALRPWDQGAPTVVRVWGLGFRV